MMRQTVEWQCWVCISVTALLLTALVIWLLCSNSVFRYFVKMTALYFSIIANAVVCCVLCTPVHFFGDPAKLIFDLFHIFSRWTGVRCEARHVDYFYSTSGPYVVVANHQSSVDIVVLSYVWPPNCTIMMKKSLRWIPFFNYACYLANTIFVDRFNREKAMHSLKECVQRIVDKKLSLLIFPEGTRNHEGGLLPFKKGAFNVAVQAGIPIIPLVISSYKPFYDKETHYFANEGYVIAEVMEPIATKGLTLNDVPGLAEEVRKRMEGTFDRISAEAAVRFAQRNDVQKDSNKND